MKILLKILFENEAEYLKYQQEHSLPMTAPESTVKHDPEPEPEPRVKPKFHCKYWNCKKPIRWTPENPNPLYCSSKCEQRDSKVQEQNEKLKEIKSSIPVRRGRPPMRKDSQS